MAFYQRKFFKNGLPLILFVVGGSFALTTVTQIRYRLKERRENFGLTPEAKRALAKSTYGQSIESSDNQSKPVLTAIENSDELTKKAFNEFLNARSKPISESDLNDPEFKKKKAKLEEMRGKKLTLEEEYGNLRKKDLNKWENKRVPRPYEEKDES